MYRVVVERSAEKDLRKLPVDVRFRVANALRSLANNPRPVGSRKLAGTKHDWRIRVSDYRVIYEIADSIKVVRVYRIRHRREVYR
jgi:mRNA interferase RelE/StbE